MVTQSQRPGVPAFAGQATSPRRDLFVRRDPGVVPAAAIRNGVRWETR
jgi:hypothetical protein